MHIGYTVLFVKQKMCNRDVFHDQYIFAFVVFPVEPAGWHDDLLIYAFFCPYIGLYF